MLAIQASSPSQPAQQATAAERLLPADLNQSVLYLPPLLSLLPANLDAYKPASDAPPVQWTSSRLPDIDAPSRQLHDALHHFQPIDPAYAHVPYARAFNWDSLDLPVDLAHEWYAVVFRSRRNAHANSDQLYAADRAAHEEAVRAGGLIMYWYGSPDAEGHNLATCIWQSRAHAIAANAGPRHVVAMRLASAMYDHFKLERYRLVKRKGSPGIVVEAFAAPHL